MIVFNRFCMYTWSFNIRIVERIIELPATWRYTTFMLHFETKGYVILYSHSYAANSIKTHTFPNCEYAKWPGLMPRNISCFTKVCIAWGSFFYYILWLNVLNSKRSIMLNGIAIKMENNTCPFRHTSENFQLLRNLLQDYMIITLQWRHNGCDGVSNHQILDCLHNRLFRHRSKKTSKLCVTGLCEGNSPVTDELPAQSSSNAENVSIWWRLHDNRKTIGCVTGILLGFYCRVTILYAFKVTLVKFLQLIGRTGTRAVDEIYGCLTFQDCASRIGH